ncbi:DUF222 domain-containing protein [Rhodococcus sp. NPDC003318]|uniref:DUF222 domain-containing protein n=1 Tax=Rhodococcus sp. NPDC003318 TaxID=3364503 RepID=UPI0036AE7E47
MHAGGGDSGRAPRCPRVGVDVRSPGTACGDRASPVRRGGRDRDCPHHPLRRGRTPGPQPGVPRRIRQRRGRGEADRDVRFHANEDGTCTIDGTLPGPGGRVVAMRLRAMCFDVCGRDPRTFAQRRADALVALAAGATRLDCLCGRSDCDRKEPAPESPSSADTQDTTPVTADSDTESSADTGNDNTGTGTGSRAGTGNDDTGTGNDIDSTATRIGPPVGTASEVGVSHPLRNASVVAGLPPLPAAQIHVG